MNHKKLFVYILLGLFFSGQYISSQTNAKRPHFIFEPVVEILDLYVDGTDGVFVNITKDYDFIKRLIYHLHFVDNSIDFDNFGGEPTPLPNGFIIFYNDISLLNGGEPIIANGDFGHLGFDVSLTTDDKNPKGRIIIGRLSFDKINIDGLLINPSRTFSILVQDNITDLASVTEISIFIEGYKKIRDTFFELPFENKYYPNAINEIKLIFLDTNRNYNLKINSTNDTFWVNITAHEESVTIKFNQQLNENTNTLNLFLYVDDTFLEKRSLFVQSTSNSPLLGLITNFGLLIGLGIAVYVLIMMITTKGKR